MKTFQEFMSLCEASDADAAKQLGWGGGATIKKTGEGGKIGRERKKSTPEKRRVKYVGGGKTEPVEYKPRKDIGQQRSSSERQQAPTQERGSARERQLAAAKEERKKAAQARIAARKSGQSAPTAAKPKTKEATAAATKLLSKKKETKPVSPDYKPAKPTGYSASERKSIQRKGEAKLSGIMKQQEFSRYEKETGQKPTGKAKTKLLARVHQRMSN
jgi:hypothetical protein